MHLRRKWQTGKRYVNSAEEFISRIASRSSITHQPYQVKCEHEFIVDAADWLILQLDHSRESSRSVSTNLPEARL